MVTRAQPQTPVLKATFTDFSRGAGAYDHVDGYYAVMTNGDGRWGPVIPGPREVIDDI